MGRAPSWPPSRTWSRRPPPPPISCVFMAACGRPARLGPSRGSPLRPVLPVVGPGGASEALESRTSSPSVAGAALGEIRRRHAPDQDRGLCRGYERHGENDRAVKDTRPGVDPPSWTPPESDGHERPTMAVHRARQSPEFRREMVEALRSGLTPREFSRQLEPSAAAVRNWQGRPTGTRGAAATG